MTITAKAVEAKAREYEECALEDYEDVAWAKETWDHYVDEYLRNTPEEDQSEEDLENYLDQFEIY